MAIANLILLVVVILLIVEMRAKIMATLDVDVQDAEDLKTSVMEVHTKVTAALAILSGLQAGTVLQQGQIDEIHAALSSAKDEAAATKTALDAALAPAPESIPPS